MSSSANVAIVGFVRGIVSDRTEEFPFIGLALFLM